MGAAHMLEVHVCNSTGATLKAFALGDTSEVLVGRDDSCDIRILASSVSREHCCIERDGDEMFIRDLGSTGGTFLSEGRIDRIRISDGMEVRVGPAVLRFFDNDI